MSSKEKEKFIVDRVPRILYLPDLFKPGFLKNLAYKISRSLSFRKDLPFVDGYDLLHSVEERYEGGVLFLTYQNNIVLVSLPEEDYGIDRGTSFSKEDVFLPTKTEYIPNKQQIETESYFWFNTEILREEMFSIITGGIKLDEDDHQEAMIREASEEIGLALNKDRITDLVIPPFEVWQSSRGDGIFRGTIKDLLLGKYPVAPSFIKVREDIFHDKLPFRFGRFKFNVNSFYSYELDDEELLGLQRNMVNKKRVVKVIELNQALDEELRPSTRKALELLNTIKK